MCFFIHRSVQQWNILHGSAQTRVNGSDGPKEQEPHILRLNGSTVITSPVDPPITLQPFDGRKFDFVRRHFDLVLKTSQKEVNHPVHPTEDEQDDHPDRQNHGASTL
jgi:hypothetical protein